MFKFNLKEKNPSNQKLVETLKSFSTVDSELISFKQRRTPKE
jgi:hypothetical protein